MKDLKKNNTSLFPHVHDLLAGEVVNVAAYYDEIYFSAASPILCELRDRIVVKVALEEGALVAQDSTTELLKRRLLVVDGVLNLSHDVQGLLTEIFPTLNKTDRVIVTVYSPYLTWAYRALTTLGLRRGPLPDTLITRGNLRHLASLSGFEVVRERPVAYFPFELFGVGTFINRVLAATPILRHLCAASAILLRPLKPLHAEPGISVIVPVKNERDNLLPTLKRLPLLGNKVEVIIVDGNSTDGSQEILDELQRSNNFPFALKILKQLGKGKADAVKLGVGEATHPLIIILDGDLSVEPESLPRFIQAFTRSLGDLINGSRLVYPLEAGAMRPLNRIGNILFAKLLGIVLDANLGDSLCGTKVFLKSDYERFQRWCRDHTSPDPFGDFDLLFPAAALGLGIIEVPISYKARIYGTTKISRFRDGFRLFRMVLSGFWNVRMGQKVCKRC